MERKPNAAVSDRHDNYTYPYAPSPDIIRVHQKDAYFTSVLTTQLSNVLRTLYGARSAQRYTIESKTAADLLYLALTTLIGNRTLGEEYCDLVQVQDGMGGKAGRLPEATRRAGYVAASVLVPYALSRLLPGARRRLREMLEQNLARKQHAQAQRRHKDKEQTAQQSSSSSIVMRFQRYLLIHIETLTAPAPIYVLSLASFYFTGAYYQISKRLLGLRYILTRKLQPSDENTGYEVLGVMLVLQLAVQGYLHVQETMATSPTFEISLAGQGQHGTTARVSGNSEISVGFAATTSNDALLGDISNSPVQSDASVEKISSMMHTPSLSKPHIDLADEDQMMWLNGKQVRKCTLCLEPMKEPAAMTCGHIFCWACICDWCREKPECPLCRQTCNVQHVLLLRG